MKQSTFILLALMLSIGLAACGQRVMPKEPEGKINPSKQY